MRLRIGAMVLGFIGAIGCYLMAILALIVGTILTSEFGELFGNELPPAILLISSFPVSLMGVIGAAITLAKPRAAGILMILTAILMVFVGTAVGGILAESLSAEDISAEILGASFPMFSSILLIIAGILALIGRKEET
jgi:hypothetical protein